jgi:SsrA-binding protein
MVVSARFAPVGWRFNTMKAVVQNKKARHDFSILETFEAGIALRGTEVKSLREGRANLRDSYALLEGGEVLLRGLQIMPYSHTSERALDPMRDRKLLLNREEIRKLTIKINEKGMTLVALKVYFTERGIAKVELGLAKGKKLYDKREAIAERETRRDVDRAIKRARNE